MKLRLLGLGAVFCLVGSALGQINIGTTDSSDGSMTIANTNLNLGLAATSTWNSPSPIAGRGVYDPEKWAVVYKVNDLYLGGVSFIPHPSGCPVVFLVQGNVIIDGAVVVPQTLGGFIGGLGVTTATGSAGVGLGGGQASTDIVKYGGPASYATSGIANPSGFGPGDPYGNPGILPLVGGAGGGSYFAENGGRGGGCILIVCRNMISVNAPIYADGTNGYSAGPGAGGAVKLMANVLSGNGGGAVFARPGVGGGGQIGGQGRVRCEANTFGNWGPSQPGPSLATVGATAKYWPDSTDPSVKILGVNGNPSPLDPGAAFEAPDIQLGAVGTFLVSVECRNVPTIGTWSVTVRGVPRNGQAAVYPCTFSSGNQALSTWTTSVPFTEGLQVIQARAKKN